MKSGALATINRHEPEGIGMYCRCDAEWSGVLQPANIDNAISQQDFLYNRKWLNMQYRSADTGYLNIVLNPIFIQLNINLSFVT